MPWITPAYGCLAGNKEDLYRIAREALHNIFRHAQATQVKVRLTSDGGILNLEISDDGSGFNASDRFDGRLGLHAIERRVVQGNNTLQRDSAVGGGTRVREAFPAYDEDDIPIV